MNLFIKSWARLMLWAIRPALTEWERQRGKAFIRKVSEISSGFCRAIVEAPLSPADTSKTIHARSGFRSQASSPALASEAINAALDASTSSGVSGEARNSKQSGYLATVLHLYSSDELPEESCQSVPPHQDRHPEDGEKKQKHD